jgi:hypothetical protein
MRKMRCLFSAALLAVSATVAVPAMAADAPADPVAWTAWWQDLSAWMERLSPFGGKAVAASSDPVETTAGEDEMPPPDDDPHVVTLGTDDEGTSDLGPGVDPDG